MVRPAVAYENAGPGLGVAEDQIMVLYFRNTDGLSVVTGSGENSYGELGNEDFSIDRNGPVEHQKEYGVPIELVVVSNGVTGILTREVPPKIWGWGGQLLGTLGQGAGNVLGYGNRVAFLAGQKLADLVPTEIPQENGHVVQLGRVELNFNALLQDGTMFNWGSVKFREAGWDGYEQGVTSNIPPLEWEDTIHKPLYVSSGFLHTCVVFSNFKIRCWGYNLEGQLGSYFLLGVGIGPTDSLGTFDPSNPLAGGEYLSRMPFLDFGMTHGIQVIAAGAAHSCAIFSNGQAKCWGSNIAGQCGHPMPGKFSVGVLPPTEFQTMPFLALRTGRPLIHVAGHVASTCFLDDAGAGYCIGDDMTLGVEPTPPLTPTAYWDTSTAFIIPSYLIDIAPGRYFTCAFTNTTDFDPKNLDLLCWGLPNDSEFFLGYQQVDAVLEYRQYTNPHTAVMPSDFDGYAVYSVQPVMAATLGNTVMVVRGPPLVIRKATHAVLDNGAGTSVEFPMNFIVNNRIDGFIPVWPGALPATVRAYLRLEDGNLVDLRRDIELVAVPTSTGTFSPQMAPLRGTEVEYTFNGVGFGEFMRPLRCEFNSSGGASTMEIVDATSVTCAGVPPSPHDYPTHETVRVPVSAQITTTQLDPVYEDFETFTYYNDKVTAVHPQFLPYDGAGITVTVYGADLLEIPTDVRIQFSVFGTSVFSLKFGSVPTLAPIPRAICEAPDFSGDSGFALPQTVEVTTSFNGVDFSQVTSSVTIFKQADLYGVNPANMPADPSGTPQTLVVTGGNLFVSGQAKVRFARAGNLSETVDIVPATVTSGVQFEVASLPYADLPAGDTEVWFQMSLDNGTTWSPDFLSIKYSRLARVVPGIGTVAGGVPVTMIGENFLFTGTEQCRFNDTIVSARYLSPSELLCETPPYGGGAGSPGATVDIAVSNSGGLFTVDTVTFEYYAEPVFSALAPRASPSTPNYAAAAGPVEITLSGSSFPTSAPLGNVTCRFGPIVAVASAADATSVRCASPTGFGILPVLVTWNGGVTFHQTGLAVSLFSVASASPAVLPNAGTAGTVITVSGDGFLAAPTLSCLFVEPAPSTAPPTSETAVFLSTQSITCPLPAGANDTIEVEVTWDGGVRTHDRVEIVVLPNTPVLTHTSPSAAPSVGGGDIVVYGTDIPSIGGGITLPLTLLRIGFSVVSAKKLGDPANSVIFPLPKGGGVVGVEVSFNGGSTYSNLITFSYFSVVSIQPRAGHGSGGLVVTVSGTDFVSSASAKCRFGAQGDVPATFVSPLQMVCTSPPGPVIGGSTERVQLTLFDLSPANGTLWSEDSASVSFEYYEDPSVTLVSPSTGPAALGNVTLTGLHLTPLAAPEITYCYFGASSFPAVAVDSPSTVVCAVPDGLGLTSVGVSFNSGAQIAFAAEQFLFFTISDATPMRGADAGGTRVTLFGTGFSTRSTTRCRFGASAPVTAEVLNSAQIVCAAPAHPAGGVTLAVSSHLLGEFYEYPQANFTYFSEPVISSISPRVGPASGILVTISASNLEGNPAVDPTPLCRLGLDVSPAVSVDYTGDVIVCRAEAGSGTGVAVDISQNGGADFTSSGLTFSYYGINALEPSLGPVDGPMTVAISGFGLVSVGSSAQCRYNGGPPLYPAQVRSSLSAECPKPDGVFPAGAVSFEFSSDGIGWTATAAPFVLYETPSVTSVDPAVGPGLSTVVTVSGTNLDSYPPAAIRCRFGVTVTTGTLVGGAGDNNITCPAPAGSGSVALEVSLNGGVTFTSDKVAFSFYNLLATLPVRGPDVGGSKVTVTGTGFVSRPTLQCRFGTIVSGAQYISAAQITCFSPPQPPSSLPLAVSVDGLFYSQEPLTFSYFETPRVTSMTPLTGPTTGVTVTLYGSFNRTGETPMCRFGLRSVEIVPDSFFVGANYSSVECESPPGSSTVNVELSLNGGKDFTNDQFNFGYYSVRFLSPSSGPSSGGTEVLISGSGFQPSDSAECRFSIVRVPAIVLSAAQVRCISPGLVPGVVEVQYSSDGIVFTTGDDLLYTIYRTPSVARVTPSTARAAGGSLVTVMGTGFLNETLDQAKCRFGVSIVDAEWVHSFGIDSTVLDEIVCIAPPASGTGSVDISFNGGAHFSSTRLAVTYYQLLSAQPLAGTRAGGTVVEISGDGFTIGSSIRGELWCRFGDQIVKETVRLNDGALTCRSPPASIAGPVPLRVSSNGVDFSEPRVNFTYFLPVSITSYTPRTAPALSEEGMTRVTLTGLNFPSHVDPALLGPVCHFGETTPVRDVSIASLASMSCAVPRVASQREVRVTFIDEPFAESVSVGSVRFFSAQSADPLRGPVSGNTSVVVTGTSFSADDGAGAILCRFGGSVVVPGTLLSPSKIRCGASPPLASGMRSAMAVEVTTNGATYTKPVPYSYVTMPTVTSVAPETGPTAGGTNVTMYGTDFLGSGELWCRFGVLSSPVPAIIASDGLSAQCTTSVHVLSVVPIELTTNLQQFLPSGVNHTYVPCPPGSFSFVYTEPCVLCAKGTFAPAAGTKKCSVCPTDQYSDEEGSTSCKQCPPNSFIPNSDRIGREFCECEPGFFSNLAAEVARGGSGGDGDGAGNATAVVGTSRLLRALQAAAIASNATGAANANANASLVPEEGCVSCPSGGGCEGGFTVPQPLPGYWTSPDDPMLMMKCDVPEACPGGGNAACAPGYGGRLCAGCLPGSYVLNGRCTQCPPKARWRVLLFCVFCIGLCFVLIKVVGKNAAASGGTIGIATFFFQVLAMLAKLQLNWPYSFRVTLEIMTMPFTLNLDLLASECVFPTTYKAKWLGMWFMPWIFMGLFVAIYFLGLMLLITQCCKREKGVDLDHETSHIIGGASSLKRIKDPPLSEVDIRNRIVSAYLLFTTLVYLLPTTLSFEIFDCTIREDGKWTLDASPNLLCYEPWWYEVTPFGAVGILYYAILLPIMFGSFIFYNRHKLDMPYFISRYGSMFTDFKPTVPFWEAILMWQKVLMLLPIMFFTTFPEFQIAMFLLVLFLTLTINLIVRPFFLERYNRLQTVLRWCACLMLLLGMSIRVSEQFQDKVAAKLERAGSKGTYVVANQQVLVLSICFLMLAMGVMFILAAIAFDVTVIHWEMRRRIAPTILRNIDRLCHPHGKTIIIQWLGKGNSGQDFEDPLGLVLHSIAAERVHRRTRKGEVPELTPLDKFVDLYSGVVFTTPVLPVVRQWVLSRIERSTTDARALQELTLFGETFAQFNRFKVLLTTSRDIFPRLEHGISRVGAERYALCVREPDLYRQIIEGENVTKRLFFADVVSDTTIKAVFKQVHREVTLSLRTLQDASVTMTALDNDDPTMARSGLSLDTEVVRARMRNKTLSAEAVELIGETSHLLAPYLATMYEGSLRQHAIDNLVGMMRVSLNPRKTMLSRLSPFVYLHRLFVGTRDERDEEGVPYEYVDVVTGGGIVAGGEDGVARGEDGEHMLVDDAPKEFTPSDYVRGFFNTLFRGDEDEAKAEGVEREAARTRVKKGKDGVEEVVERRLVRRDNLGLDSGLGVAAGEGIERLPEEILLDVREASKFISEDEKERLRAEREAAARRSSGRGKKSRKSKGQAADQGLLGGLWGMFGGGGDEGGNAMDEDDEDYDDYDDEDADGIDIEKAAEKRRAIAIAKKAGVDVDLFDGDDGDDEDWDDDDAAEGGDDEDGYDYYDDEEDE